MSVLFEKIIESNNFFFISEFMFSNILKMKKFPRNLKDIFFMNKNGFKISGLLGS